MMFSMTHGAVLQLVAVALHHFLVGILLFASPVIESGQPADYRPARESRLIALNDVIEIGALSRSVKRFDSHSLGVLGAAAKVSKAFHAEPSVPFALPHDTRCCRHSSARANSIRSPPAVQFILS
jgi:hypothetical protein